MDDDDTAAPVEHSPASGRVRRPWWKTPDAPSRTLVVGSLFAVAAIASWALVALDVERRIVHLLLATAFSVFSVRSLATWLTTRGQRS